MAAALLVVSFLPGLASAASAGIGPSVVVLTLAAAVLHATWNAIAAGVCDRLIGFALIGTAYSTVCGAAVVVLGLPPQPSWRFIVVSAAIHIVYQLLLLASYQRGEFSQVYPLARGTSPWVVAVVTIEVLGRKLPISQLAGVLVISAGLISLVFLGGLTRARVPAVGVAFATGVCIAGYTVIDGLGVAQTPVPTYAAWMFLLQGPALPLLALARRGRALPAQMRSAAMVGLLGGVLSLAAYGLVLRALASGALAAVAALRETSIIIGALLGAIFLGERLGRARALASVVVVSGIVLISLR